MMNKRRLLPAALLSLILAGFSASHPSWAAEAIDTVYLTVEDAGDLTAGAPIGEVTVAAQDPWYYVDSAYFLNDHDFWQRNERPKVRVELYADESYRFTHTSKRYFSLDGYEAEFASASIMDGGSYMELDLYLERVSGDWEGSRDSYSLSWDGYTAVWDDAYGTDRCEVRLYRWNGSGSNSSIVTTKKTDLNEYDFTSYMTSQGYYTFRVRPYDPGYDASQLWSDHSDRLYVDKDEAADNRDDDFSSDDSRRTERGGPGYDGSEPYPGAWDEEYRNARDGYDGPGYDDASGYEGNPRANSAGQWIRDSSGVWYRYHNGGWPFNSWQMIEGKWYYFNRQGYLQTGWIQADDAWYYSLEDGSMATGWQKIGPSWYYLSNTGQMMTGWILVGGGWYYLDPATGAMWAGQFTPDGHYVNADGVRLY